MGKTIKERKKLILELMGNDKHPNMFGNNNPTFNGKEIDDEDLPF